MLTRSSFGGGSSDARPRISLGLDDRTLRVAVLCSKRAPGLMHLLTEASGRNRQWQIVCCLTSELGFDGESDVVGLGMPVIHHPRRQFYAERDPQARLRDMHLREEYDRRTVDLLRPYRPDVVLLAGYLLLLTDPMLCAFPDRIVNVHHADLLLRDADGGPRFPGLRAVRDAILAGEVETRATAHIVNARLDDGVPLVVSEPFPVSELAAWALAEGESARAVLRQEIRAHEERMLRTSFGPVMAKALDLLSSVTVTTPEALAS